MKQKKKEVVQNQYHFDEKIKFRYQDELNKRRLNKREVANAIGVSYHQLVMALNGIVYEKSNYPWPKRYRKMVDKFLADYDKKRA